jgi:NAD(P)-dependent dehydrogenase (short-subunit alcohol dehydrogenase family)
VTLEGRGVLVVGAGSPHGRAVALLAAARGAAVVFSVAPGEEERAAEIEAVAQGRAGGVIADPTREEEAERLFAAAVGRLSGMDVVVNAAPDLRPRSLAETSREEWDGAVSRGLRGAFFVSRLAVEEFLAHGAGGRLVHVAPLVLAGEPGQALAAASLEAQLSLMRSTAKEYGPRGICCNAVVPAGHESSGSADAVAEAVLFLASREASYVNGEALRVQFGAPAVHPGSG